MTLEEKEKVYRAWADEQEKKFGHKFLNAYGELDNPDLEIPYLHMTHIGGSVAPALMGVSKWENAAQVYDKMTGVIDTSIPVHNFVFDRGHWAEGFIRAQVENLLHMPVLTGDTFYDEERVWSLAQIDSFVDMRLGHDKDIPCEIKCVSVNASTDDGKEWGRGCVINDNGEIIQEDDLVPVAYYIQCQKQMYVYGCDKMYLAAWLTFENRIRLFVIHRDDEIIEKIKQVEDDFLFNNVIAGVRPAEAQVVSEVIKDKTMQTNDRLNELLERYHALEQEVSPKKKELDALKEQISELMADAAVLLDADGNKLVTKTNVTTSRFNSTKLKNDDAELYAKYLTTTNSIRLTIKK